jgi:hypothetical protein
MRDDGKPPGAKIAEELNSGTADGHRPQFALADRELNDE